MTDFSHYRFGRRPQSILALAQAPKLMAARFGQVPPPPVLDRSKVDFRPRMFGNDAWPDCTAAAIGNLIIAAGALNGFDPVVEDASIPAFYAAVAGIADTPASLAASDGVVLLSALERASHQGIDVGQQQRLFPFIGTVACNRYAIAHTMAEFAAADLGIRLYERDMECVAAGKVLDASGSDPGALVGRHSLLTWDYTNLGDAGYVSLVTYGTVRVWIGTWRWLAARTDEAHGVYFRSLMPAALTAVDEARLAEARGFSEPEVA